MNHPYHIICQNSAETPFLLATVVEGAHAGEKLLIQEGTCLFGGEKETFLGRHRDAICASKDSGLMKLEDASVFVERFGGTPQLVVCGAGTVGQALIAISSQTGFSVTALEDRQEYAETARKLGAQRVICRPFEEALDELTGSPSTYFVVVTREHRYDRACLRLIFRKERAYVGMMGSRKRVGLLKEQLAEEGIDSAALESLHAPIGLAISAETPEEIAVSILAELIQVKNHRRQTEGFSHKMLQALQEGNCVLTEIVDRIGSTPRGIGTKMVVFPDGTHVGTVGGGWMEADVIRQAQNLLQMQEKTRLHHSEMVSGGTSGSPMLCGGSQLIYMEKVQ